MRARRAIGGSTSCSASTHLTRLRESTGTVTHSTSCHGPGCAAALRFTNAVSRRSGRTRPSASIRLRAYTSMPPVSSGTRKIKLRPMWGI